jgi:uncharacterized protein YndB with AHSA1/START domain
VSEPSPERVVELRIRLGAPPDEVFPFFVDPERYVRWQGVKAELDPRPGGTFRVWMDVGAVARGEYIAVEAPRRVVFTWGWEDDPSLPPGSTTVELTLDPDGEGTLLTLRHSGLPDDESAAVHEEGWVIFIGRLQIAVGGGEPGPMPEPPA